MSKGKGNGDRPDIPERFNWKCSHCHVKGTAATRRDAADMKRLHEALVHGK